MMGAQESKYSTSPWQLIEATGDAENTVQGDDLPYSWAGVPCLRITRRGVQGALRGLARKTETSLTFREGMSDSGPRGPVLYGNLVDLSPL